MHGLKILVITWTHPMPPGSLIAQCFADKGCVVEEIKYNVSAPDITLLLNQWKKSLFHFRPDLVLIMKGAKISKEILTEIKTLSTAKLALWLVDNALLELHPDNIWPPHYRTVEAKAYPLYDTVFMYDSFDVSHCRQLGLHNAVYLPLAFCESIYHPLNSATLYDMSFIGYRYLNRERLIGSLKGFHLGIGGCGWEGSSLHNYVIKDYVPYASPNHIYNQSKIVLNIHSPQSVHGGNLRNFEVLGSGSVLCAERLKDLLDLFSEDEVVFYSSAEELKEKISFLLANDQKRRQIAQNGHQCAIAHHTFSHRINSILNTLYPS